MNRGAISGSVLLGRHAGVRSMVMSIVASLGVTSMLGGCSSSDRPRPGPSVSLRPSDFVGGATDDRPSVDEPEVVTGPPAIDAPTTTNADAREGLGDIEVTPGAPAIPDRPAPSMTGVVLVDAKIGNINGRPIYANTFLDEMEARLRAMADQLPRERWRMQAASIIQETLYEQIHEELILAEAYASLTPQEQQGLSYFIRQLRNDAIRQSGGSQAAANRFTENEKGITLDEFIEDQKETELLKHQLNKAVNNRVHVSWREIEQAYDRQADRFNPSPTATFIQVYVSNRDPEDIEAIQAVIDAGTPLHEVAKLPENRAPDEGVWERPISEDFESGTYFNFPELNEIAQGLSPGETAGPIVAGPFTWWIELVGTASESVSLYDAQIAIERDLRDRLRNEATIDYVVRLQGRASYTNVREMTLRILQIAEERYYPLGVE